MALEGKRWKRYLMKEIEGATMVKVEYVTLGAAKDRRAGSVTSKRVRDAGGKLITVYTVDADSSSFGDDMTYVFAKNVTRARRESRRLADSRGSGHRSKLTRPRLDAPRFWIVAGPNGSGKSTLYDATDIEGFGRSVWIINPDLLSLWIHQREGFAFTDANLEALVRIQIWLNASLRAHQTVGVETVLSTGKYRKLVERAKTLGFEIRLLYVMLKTVELNVQRVRQRVNEGGHDVPEDKIRLRRERSLRQMPWFLEHADVALIYDNSGASPKLIGRKQHELIEIDRSAPVDFIAALRRDDDD